MSGAIAPRSDASPGISQLQVPKCSVGPLLVHKSIAARTLKGIFSTFPSLPKPLLVDQFQISAFSRLMSTPGLPPRGQIIASIRSSCRAAREAANIRVSSLFPFRALLLCT